MRNIKNPTTHIHIMRLLLLMHNPRISNHPSPIKNTNVHIPFRLRKFQNINHLSQNSTQNGSLVVIYWLTIMAMDRSPPLMSAPPPQPTRLLPRAPQWELDEPNPWIRNKTPRTDLERGPLNLALQSLNETSISKRN